MLDGRGGEVFLTLEVVVERTFRHPDSVEHRLEAGAVITLFEKQGNAFVQKTLSDGFAESGSCHEELHNDRSD